MKAADFFEQSELTLFGQIQRLESQFFSSVAMFNLTSFWIRYNSISLSKHRNLVSTRITNYLPSCGYNRAQNNGRSTDNVRPDRGFDRSNSRLDGHFDRSFLDACRLIRFAL